MGDDTIHGGPGDDWINGDSGEDIAYPGPGTDELYMDDGESDLIYCASDPLDYVVFDEGIDELNACPGLNYAVAR